MRKMTLKKWLPIFEAYDPEKHGSQRAYCESIGVSYNQYKVYKHRLEHGQKSYSKYVKKGQRQDQDPVQSKEDQSTKASDSIRQVYIIGKGAVGSTMGTFFHQGLGDQFAFYMEPERKEKYQQKPILINDKPVKFNLKSNQDNPPKADLILITTKFSGFEKAMELTAEIADENTILLSGLNGISSEELLRERFPENVVIRTIAQKMDSIYKDGNVTFTTPGELVIGIDDPDDTRQKEAFEKVTVLFDEIHLPYVKSKDILLDQYSKLMMNCAINQICAVYQKSYGQVLDEPEIFDLFVSTMKEVKEVANAKGIPLTDKHIEEWIEATRKLSHDSMPSMLQDRLARRKSELELFSGTVIPLAKEVGIEVPNLQKLYEAMIEIEQAY